MIRIEQILGNATRGFDTSTHGPVDELWLTRWEAQKRRLRKRTAGGRDVALALARAGTLADGDVLYAGPDATVIARVEAGEVVVFRLHEADTTAGLAANALRLGHILGNQHWPLRLRVDSTDLSSVEIVVPLSLDRRVVDAVIRAHRLEGVSYHFRAATAGEVLDQVDPPEAHQNDHAYDDHRHGPVDNSAIDAALRHDHGDGRFHNHAPTDSPAGSLARVHSGNNGHQHR